MRRILSLMFALLLLSPAYAAKITVQADRSPVYAGEVFTLIFSSSARPEANPDFTPLNKTLDVLEVNASRDVQITNNIAVQEFAWRLQAIPKKAGIIQIPAIQFGKDASHPLQIVVSDSKNNKRAEEIIVELESSTDTPYVQQQIIVTQRLLHSVPLSRNGATMSHPRISGGKGLVQQLGGIENRTELRKGVRYRVSERRYAVFAQSSGKLTLGRTVFEGILSDGTNRRDFFGMSGKQVRRFSAPLELTIRAQPPQSGATWLPANSLSVNAHWEVPPTQFKTGEPVTLTLAVIADGLLAEQLPELNVQPPKGIKAYSNQPELLNNSEGDTVLATRQEKWILIGTAPGEYTLPKITLQWWNTVTGQLETAAVPATAIKVSGEASGTLAEPVLPDATAAVVESQAERTNPEGEEGFGSAELISDDEAEALPDAGQRSAVGKPPFSAFWLWLAGALALGLVTLGILWRRHAQRTAKRQYERKVAQHRIMSLDLLRQACRRNEPQKAYDALSDWVKQDLQLRPATLSQLRKEADFPLKQALDELSMALYSYQHDVWEGRALWEAVTQYGRPVEQQAEAPPSGLVSMYPE